MDTISDVEIWTAFWTAIGSIGVVATVGVALFISIGLPFIRGAYEKEAKATKMRKQLGLYFRLLLIKSDQALCENGGIPPIKFSKYVKPNIEKIEDLFNSDRSDALCAREQKKMMDILVYFKTSSEIGSLREFSRGDFRTVKESEKITVFKQRIEQLLCDCKKIGEESRLEE